MAKRNKKATGRPGSTKLKIGRGNKPIHKELKIEGKIVENRVTTFTGNTISNEATVAPSVLREYSSRKGSSSKDQDNPTSANRTQERSLQSQIFPESGVTDSEITINDAVRINPEDIKMKAVPQQTAENTFSVLPKISYTPETSKMKKEKDNSKVEPKNDLPSPGTSRSEPLKDHILTVGSRTVLENQVDEGTYVPIEDPDDKIFRVKKKIRKKYKNRPPNLKQRANIAVRRLQIYL